MFEEVSSGRSDDVVSAARCLLLGGVWKIRNGEEVSLELDGRIVARMDRERFQLALEVMIRYYQEAYKQGLLEKPELNIFLFEEESSSGSSNLN
ncbi:hypothetical protein GF380_04945 [Candidatus Uhrbacteria bacterium]|nr:hypothetical protein [Candidatus Uhrbacteria bacterium]